MLDVKKKAYSFDRVSLDIVESTVGSVTESGTMVVSLPVHGPCTVIVGDTYFLTKEACIDKRRAEIKKSVLSTQKLLLLQEKFATDLEKLYPLKNREWRMQKEAGVKDDTAKETSE